MSPAASSSSRRAALLTHSSQLALAFRDGLAGEHKGQLKQVNLTPEGIYLEGQLGGPRRREDGEQRGLRTREKARRRGRGGHERTASLRLTAGDKWRWLTSARGGGVLKGDGRIARTG